MNPHAVKERLEWTREVYCWQCEEIVSAVISVYNGPETLWYHCRNCDVQYREPNHYTKGNRSCPAMSSPA